MADDLERRLREPAPDEPIDLPPLVLPRDRDGLMTVVAGRGSRGGGGWPGRGAVIGLMGVLVALAFVGVMVTGAPRPSPSASSVPSATPGATGTAVATTASPADTDLTTFDFDKLHFSYPAAWHQLAGMIPFSGGSVIVLLGSSPVDGCGPVDVNCINQKPLAEGEVRVMVESAFMRGGTLDDLAPPGGWVDSIDGMRAKLVVDEGTAGVGADGFRTWTIAMPGELAAYYDVSGVYRGPGADALMASVDAVARSFHFDDKPAPLDPAQAPEALRLGIDAADRSAREQFVDFYACFPREAGERAVTLRSWAGGPLPAAVPVTCASAIEPTTTAELWKIVLTVSWKDGDGYAAGTWRDALYVDASGKSSGEELLTPDASLPEAATEAPPPVESAPAIPSRSVVEVLWPGTSVMLSADPNGDGLSGIDAGRRLLVVAGPETHDGIEWYRVQWTPTPSYPAILGWIPATDLEHHPLLRVVEAACPNGAPDMPDLLVMIPAERLSCFAADELTLGPVQARERDPDLAVRASPAWLAGETRWLLYGRDGIDGVMGGMRVYLSPDLEGSLQAEGWYQVRGHFDDPSSSTCTRAWTGDEASTLVPESAAEQVLSCQEHFVVTSVTEASPPP